VSERGRIAEYRGLAAERPFIDKAYAGALGDEDRLRYAEVVEEGDPPRAEWLRLEVALHSRATDDPAVLARFIALAGEIGRDYADLLLRERIMNCGREGLREQPPRVRFSSACSKRWETLAPTADGSVRFCQQCEESVYYCGTIADAETRALAGQCIAIPRQLAEEDDEGAVLGRPSPAPDWGSRLFTLGPGSRDAHLLVIYARDQALPGRSFALAARAPRVTTVGRGADSTILLNSDAVSRCHARFERRGDVWWVVDAGSTNGTYVNDEQVREAALRRGDRVTIGDTIFKLVNGSAMVEPGYVVTTIDGLTGLNNRRHLREQIDRALGSTGRGLALALLDIDGFIYLNDRHGHLVGDQVLVELAGLLRGHVRAGDVLARYAGDQFALLLPDTELEGAAAIVARLRADIAAHGFVGERAIPVTLSAGVACAGEGVRGTEALIRAAEASLFAVKAGRRRGPDQSRS
jgi:two-component system cell cycle response regulator